MATTLANMDFSISSELDGNPPLWVTRRRDAMHDDIYVNNAKVDISRSYQAYNENGKLQVIREVFVVVLERVNLLRYYIKGNKRRIASTTYIVSCKMILYFQ